MNIAKIRILIKHCEKIFLNIQLLSNLLYIFIYFLIIIKNIEFFINIKYSYSYLF